MFWKHGVILKTRVPTIRGEHSMPIILLTIKFENLRNFLMCALKCNE